VPIFKSDSRCACNLFLFYFILYRCTFSNLTLGVPVIYFLAKGVGMNKMNNCKLFVRKLFVLFTLTPFALPGALCVYIFSNLTLGVPVV